MPVTHNTIIVENVLNDVLGYIPSINGYAPKFGYGDDEQLAAYLKASKGDVSKPYPLIWLVYPSAENHYKNKVEVQNAVFILAVDTAATPLNAERLNTSFKDILMPLFNSFKEVLTRANVINMEHNFTCVKFPNYKSFEDKNKTIDRWDALRVTCSFYVIDTCLKEIKI